MSASGNDSNYILYYFKLFLQHMKSPAVRNKIKTDTVNHLQCV